jgi:hypothetical protein
VNLHRLFFKGKSVPPQGKGACPWCGEEGQGSMQHYLINCTILTEQQAKLGINLSPPVSNFEDFNNNNIKNLHYVETYFIFGLTVLDY